MLLDPHRSLDVPIVPDFLLPDDVDKQAARERLARLRTTLAAHDVGAAVFFDAINIRYALLVAPGLFAGALFWWRQRPALFAQRRLRRCWQACVILSVLITVLSNPNRSLSWLIPDSIQPWVHRSPWRQWQHASSAHDAMALIPADASVAANSPLVPHLAARPILVRFPYHTAYQDREGKPHPVDWLAVDIDYQARYADAFPQEQKALKKTVRLLRMLQGEGYRVQRVSDGVAILERNGPVRAEVQQQLDRLLDQAKQN